jgi:type II secretion system protein D
VQVKPEKSAVIIPNADLGKIVVVAPKSVQEEVAKVIATLDMKGPNESVVAYYPIQKADLNETASVISQIYNLTLGSPTTTTTPSRARGRTQRGAQPQVAQVNTVIPDENLNALIVVAAQKLQDEIKATIARLDVVGPGERVVKYYQIKNAQVTELAKTLSGIFDLEVDESATAGRATRRAASRGRQTQVKPEMKPVIIPQPELATIVVVASKPVQEQVGMVIANLDMVGPQTNVVEYYRLQYTDIEETANILSQIFGIKVGSPSTAYRATRGRGGTTEETRKLTSEKVIIPDDNLNNIIVVAPKEVQEEVKRALAVVDVVGPRDNELRFYEVDNTQVDSAAQIVSQLYNIPIGSTTQSRRTTRGGKTTTKKYGVDPVIIPDSELGSIVINAPPDIHEEIEKVLKQLHFLGTQERMAIKFYRLKNTDAEEIADKIGSLFGITVSKVSSTSTSKAASTRNTRSSMPMPSSSRSGSSKSRRISSATGAPKPLLAQESPDREADIERPEDEEEEEGVETAKKEFQYGGEPVVVPDKNLNSIIVIAPEYVHEEIDKIIKQLDQRRPQVMFEVAIIDVSADTELDLGVEWTAVDTPTDGTRGHGFSNLGVGERQGGATGFPSTTKVPTDTAGTFAGVTRGTYGNVPLLMRVLSTNNNVNIRSTPILLVNDNEQASFSSLISEPTTSISQGTATTHISFSGFVDAGTVLQLTPHISEGDYIRLEIMLQADTWLGASTTSGIPPAKSTNYLDTMVTVPNNRTVIIGGLTSEMMTRTRRGIPILMDIPLLGALFRHEVLDKKRSKLYLFVRPIILDDEKFEDLSKISDAKQKEADEHGVPGDAESKNAEQTPAAKQEGK